MEKSPREANIYLDSRNIHRLSLILNKRHPTVFNELSAKREAILF